MDYADIKTRNPFTPSFGTLPEVMAGRSLLLSQIGRAFQNGPGDPNLATILVGARGTGKTALLAAITQAARKEGWICASVSALEGMLDDILLCAQREARHLGPAKDSKKLVGLEIAQVIGLSWENEPKGIQNWRGNMASLLEALAESDTGLLITVDEVNPSLPEMRQLVSVYQHFVQEGRKVALCMAGLPHRVSTLLNDGDISFLRRARRHDIGRISDIEVREAFKRTIELANGSISDEALEHAVQAIGGFPYMFQLVGWWMWEGASNPEDLQVEDVARGADLAMTDLRQSVLDITWNEMSPVDRKFAALMADVGETATLAEIASLMGVKSNYATKYKNRLLEQGVIGEYGRNNLRFEIPGSREFFRECYEQL